MSLTGGIDLTKRRLYFHSLVGGSIMNTGSLLVQMLFVACEERLNGKSINYND